MVPKEWYSQENCPGWKNTLFNTNVPAWESRGKKWAQCLQRSWKELPVKKHCSRGRESNSFLPRYRRISACYLEQLKTNKNTPPHLKKNPKPTPPNKKPNNYSALSLTRTAQQREKQSGRPQAGFTPCHPVLACSPGRLTRILGNCSH